jgi:hypothetical protein
MNLYSIGMCVRDSVRGDRRGAHAQDRNCEAFEGVPKAVQILARAPHAKWSLLVLNVWP